MSLSFELVLIHYHNPKTLRNWLQRHLNLTDLGKYLDSGQGHVTIADTGSDDITETLELLAGCMGDNEYRVIHTNTSEIRQRVPPDICCRPAAFAANLATDYSDRDLIIYSIIGSVPQSDHFSKVLSFHEDQERLFLQADQFRLESPTYHVQDFTLPFREALLRGTVVATTGMPDWSVRRKWLQEIGGWDESYIAWGMVDIDLCCRFTGRIDTGQPAHEWMAGQGLPMGGYTNLGLKFCKPEAADLCSIVCQDYDGVHSYTDGTRGMATKITMAQFLGQWGVVKRNFHRQPIKHEVCQNGSLMFMHPKVPGTPK